MESDFHCSTDRLNTDHIIQYPYNSPQTAANGHTQATSFSAFVARPQVA